MKVEVVYALPDVQHSLVLDLPAGATVADAVTEAEQDLLFCRFPLRTSAVGVWGEVVTHDRTLKEGDRLEIYRPLVADPKDARRARAATRPARGRE